MAYHYGDELIETYETAQNEAYGFFASNVTQFDILLGFIRGASQANSDLVTQLSPEAAAFFGDGNASTGLYSFGNYLTSLAMDADIGVFCNIDHIHLPDQIDFLEECLNSGIPSSVMVDASDKSFEENIKLTRSAVKKVEQSDSNVLVEAELGRIAGTEGQNQTPDDEAFYTSPEDTIEFVERTGCDLLAISVGTQHGVASSRNLDVRPDLAAKINQSLSEAGYNVPLVVHGASGLTDDQIRSFVDAGVCKFNKNTRYQYEYARTAADFYHEHSRSIRPPQEAVGDKNKLLSSDNWNPDKTYFHPKVVASEIRERLAEVMIEMCELSRSAGKSRYIANE
jgi:ketose-bisphosphate aldolase